MPNILFLRASNHFGGIERQMLWHARQLQTDDWQVHVATLHRQPGQHPLALAAKKLGLANSTLPDPSPWSLHIRRKIAKLLAAVQPDIIHTVDYRSDTIIATLAARPRWLAETQGHTLERRRMHLWNWLDVQALRRADLVAPVSEAWQQHLLQKGVTQAHMRMLGNSRAILPDSPLPAPQHLPGPGPHLLYAGRLSPEKGIDLLLETWPTIRQKWPQARLWILGRLAPATTWQRHIRKLLPQPGVRWMGQVPDIRAWLLAATVVIMPSRQEAWGMTAFETLRLGTPLLATRAGGLPQVCAGASHAHLVPPNSAEALLAGLKQTLENDFPRGAALGQAYASQQHFSPAHRHQRLLSIYRTLLVSSARSTSSGVR